MMVELCHLRGAQIRHAAGSHRRCASKDANAGIAETSALERGRDDLEVTFGQFGAMSPISSSADSRIPASIWRA